MSQKHKLIVVLCVMFGAFLVWGIFVLAASNTAQIIPLKETVDLTVLSKVNNAVIFHINAIFVNKKVEGSEIIWFFRTNLGESGTVRVPIDSMYIMQTVWE
jgi:hypothetical protein